MENKKHLIAAQAFILMCALALPFISLYCQEKSPTTNRHTTRAVRTKQTRDPRVLTRKRPAAAQPTAQIEEPAQQAPTAIEQETDDTDITEPLTTTQQVQAAMYPNTWNWYSTFAPLLLASLYKGSETGISSFTSTLIKMFVTRRKAMQAKEELLQDLALKPENYLTMIPPKDALEIVDTLQELDKKTSVTAIMATGAYVGMLNTAIPMLGILMGSAVKIALQMLMPADNS